MKTSCYVWNESDANKGSCEIATSVFAYLNKLNKEGIKKVYLFADRCTGQNNNHAILVMLSIAICTFNFDSITMHYLVTGHSQTEADSAHSCIEAYIHDREIYTMDEWIFSIRMAFTSHRPEVQKVRFDDIIDFKNSKANPVLSDFLKKNKYYEVVDENGKTVTERLYLKQIMQAKFEKSNPSVMLVRFDYNVSPWHEIELYKLTFTRHRSENLFDLHKLSKLYEKPPGIANDKKRDLLNLCNKQLINESYHKFYEDLPIKDD